MKKICLIVVLTIMVASLILGGCTTATPPTPKPTPSPAPTPTPPPAAAKEEVNIRFAHWWPTGSDFEKEFFVPGLADLKKKTNGRIGYTIYGSESVMKAADTYDGVARGLADMAYITTTFMPGRFPLTDVVTLPVYYKDSNKLEVDASKPVFNNILYKEFPEVKPLSMYANNFFYYTGTKKEVSTLEDLKGLKLRSPGGIMTDTIAALGATPILMPLPDVYQALQTGVIDGCINAPVSVITYKHDELIKYVTKGINLGAIANGIIMNKDFYAKLPNDLKATVDESGWILAYYHAAYIDKSQEGDWVKIGKGAKVTTLSSQEAARWNAALNPMVDQWVARLEAKGLAAKATLAAFKESFIKQGLDWPFK